MSRIGKQPIPLPGGVSLQTAPDRKVTVKGPKGSLDMSLRPEVDVAVEDGHAVVSVNGSGAARQARAFHGMTRALLSNMVDGVVKGFERKLEIVGVGWNASIKGQDVVLNIGFCHPVSVPIPKGVEAECPKPTSITLRSADKQAVGQLAANIRKVRKPEPYKGKGIRYEGEYVRRKSGKTFGS
ncbi:MAG: large subunit ribosomal protein L6 [Chlamydiales bacterium]|jgi:large subunit ribosomal protein L6